MREDIVRIRAKRAVHFSHGHYQLSLGAGDETNFWAGGGPITRAEFEKVLAPEGEFEIAGAAEPEELGAGVPMESPAAAGPRAQTPAPAAVRDEEQ